MKTRIYQIVVTGLYSEPAVLDESTDLKHLRVLLREYRDYDCVSKYSIVPVD